MLIKYRSFFVLERGYMKALSNEKAYHGGQKMKHYVLKMWKTITIKIVTAFISIIGIAAMPYITKMLFDYDFSKGAKGAIFIVMLYILAIAVGMIFEYISQRHGWKMNMEFNTLMKQDLFDSLLSKNYSSFKKYDTSDYISFFNNDIHVCEQYIESIVEIIQTVLQLFVYAFFLFNLDYRLAVVIILSSFLSLIVPKLTGKELGKRKETHLAGMAAYTDAIRDLLSGFRFVNNETRENISERHKEVLVDTEQKQYHFGKFNTLTNVVTGSSMYFLEWMVFAVIGVLLFKGEITVGIASAALGYIQSFCYPVSYILKDINNVNACRAATKKMIPLINEKVPELPSVDDFGSSIEFQDVSTTLGDFTFSHFSHTFEKGKKYAIVGPSGTGKSTIFNLLMQYIAPTEGKILMDGKPISGKDTSKVMICVNQFEHIFHASFAENATVFGTYPEKQINDTLTYFNNEKVNSLTEKANAQDLSGGENQMMQLIRAVAAEKQIILMDESFSAVDAANAKQLQQKLLELNKTILFITHDISEENLRYFDEVVRLERK